MNLGLSGQKYEELQNALVDAFPTEASLEQMLCFKLDKNLHEIATGTNLQEIVFKLIQKASAEGWVENLIDAAHNANPGNPKLTDILNSHNKPKNRSGQSNTKQVNRLVIKLDGIDLEKFLKDKEIQSAVSLLLKKASGDTSINIEKVEEGSIKITLSGTPEGLEKLADLIHSGELGELTELEELGLSIEDAKLILESTTEKNKSATKTSSPKNINIRQNPITTKQVFTNLIRGNLVGAFRIFRNLSRTNLSGAKLTGANLSRANLSHNDLSSANLSHTDLSSANLSRANLSHTDLSSANLSHTNLSGTIIDLKTKLDKKWRLVWEIVNQGDEERNLNSTDLSRAYLSGVNFSGANLIEANLSGANLSGADLSGADLTSADLSGADLTSADLSGANLTSANLTSANLSLANLSGADLSGANLTSANLSLAYLSGADLSGANLTSANLSLAYLSGADLSGADLTSANLSDAYLSGANLTSANLSLAYLSGAYLNGTDLSCANLSRANLSGANLSRANLSGAYLINANLINARFGYNQGISEELKLDLIRRGAIFEDSPGDREAVIIPR